MSSPTMHSEPHRRPHHDDVSLRGPAQSVSMDVGTAAITDMGKLALWLPDPHWLCDDVAIALMSDGAGIGLEFRGDPAGLTWLARDAAISLARGILARLEPTALVPRRFKAGEVSVDASREELVAMAMLVCREEADTGNREALEAFAGGLLEGLNATLEDLGYAPAVLEEILPAGYHRVF